jgi:hypothetical protein
MDPDEREELEEREELIGEVHGFEREVSPEDEARFSEGQEQIGDTPRKEHEGRFSEGMEIDDPSAPINQERDEEPL